MRATRGRSTSTTRAMALALALTIPLLAACDDHAGLPELSGAAGELQELVGASAQEPSGDSPTDAAARVLDAPGGVAVNQGVRYVADTGHQRVLRFSAEGTCVVVAGPAAPDDSLAWCTADPSGQPVPNTQQLLQHPTAIAVDTRGDVFVADPQASRIFMVDGETRAFSTVVGTGERGAPVSGALAVDSPLSTPTALAVARDGSQLYIADSSAHQVLSVDVSALTSTDGPGPLLDGPPVPRMTMPAPSATSSAPTPSGSGSPSSAPTSSSSSPTSTGSPTGQATPDDASTDDDASFTPLEEGESAAIRVQAVPGDDGEQDATDDGSSTDGADEQTGEQTGKQTRTDTEGEGGPATIQDDPSGGPGETEPSDSPSAAPSTQGRLFVVAGPGCAPTADGRPALDATVPALTAGLSSPSALTLVEGVESMPELYVADSANRQIYSVSDGAPDEARELTTVASDDPALAHLGAIAVVNSMGEKFVVADTSTGELLTAPVWDESRTWTVLNDELEAPSALAADRSSVLVTDSDTDGLYGIAVGDGSEPSTDSTSPSSEEDAERGPRDIELLAASTPLAADERGAAPAAAAACAPVPAPASGSSDRDLTPQSTPSSSRPKVPGNAVVPDPGTHRFSGDDRVATSVDTSQKLFPKAGSVPVVVISSASSYADSAGGARYAAEKGGSLLLTPGSRLDPAVEAEVRRSLAAGGSIVVTGREDAITPSVFSALEAIAPGRTERIGGADRYETATKLAQRLADQMTTTSTGPIYLVTGADYSDALVVVSLARRTGGLIVLSKDGVLPPVTRTLLQQMDPTGARTVPVGGAAAEAAASLGGEAGRTAAAAAVVGSDRYETARKVAERFVALDAAAGARTDVVGLATGTTWPDALVGSTAMGTLVGPLLLNHGDQLDPNVVKALAAIPSSRPSTTVVFGGEKAVPASVMAAFGAAAKG